MTKLKFGTHSQICFKTQNDFYEALGFLSKNDGTTSIHWEHNEKQGAWGSEGRIHCYKNISSFPAYFSSAFTAGTGRIVHRINCNEYIEHLINNHAIKYGVMEQDEDAIRNTVPEEYLGDYLRGLSL